MIAAVALVLTFGSSSNLAAAYGVGVATDMVITTVLLFIVMKQMWKWSVARAVALTGVFLVVDLVFFGANITKVPAGGWFPLVIGLIGFVLMTTWRTGRKLLAMRQAKSELPVERFIASIVEHPQQRVAGTGVYLFAEPGVTPPTLLTNLRHHEVLHETIVLVAIRVARRARVPQAERATVHNLGHGFSQIVLHYGFMQEPDVPAALGNIVHREFGFDETEATYFLGRETVLATELPGMMIWREELFSFMHRNATSAARFFSLPHDRVIEVGVQVPI